MLWNSANQQCCKDSSVSLTHHLYKEISCIHSCSGIVHVVGLESPKKGQTTQLVSSTISAAWRIQRVLGLRRGAALTWWGGIWGLEKDGQLPREGNKFPGLVLLKLQFLLFFVQWLTLNGRQPEKPWQLSLEGFPHFNHEKGKWHDLSFHFLFFLYSPLKSFHPAGVC